MFFDISLRYQINLQDSATYGMEMIVQLHNYVMFLNVFIISVVIWFFFEIIAVTGFVQWFFYRVDLKNITKLCFTQLIYKQIRHAMLHMSTLEVIWTLLPVLALISIALPSLSMLYYFSLSFSPAVVVNVIGHQWFWSYEYQPYYPCSLQRETRIILDPYTFDFFQVNKNSLLDYNAGFRGSIVDADGVRYLTFNEVLNLHNNIFHPIITNLDFKLEVESEIFDSIMVQTEDLNYGSFRLLEVDKPLYLPVDTAIRLIVSSDDVLHSWAVPSLGVKIDCVPGRLNVVEFRIARTGIFYGQCSEICGTQHGFMPICVISVPVIYII